MLEANLFLLFLSPLNRSGIKYMITGSVAAMLYGEPRLTHDLDLVIDLSLADAMTLQHLFPLEQFYLPPPEVVRTEMSRARRGHFNIIHHESGFKADVYLCGDDPLHLWAFERSSTVQLDEESVMVAPPEYVVLRKLQYHKEGGSGKHVVDIKTMIASSGDNFDMKELNHWLALLGLESEWRQISES